ncbi:Translation machinery-associated protein 46 AltName: Full=DRG family-regulatory protein 1 [Serendipita indica DSM 11827]|nr:Translation machinery-associated protein 46 AltName: Full=DRG family-regulatory protein 1 [Serendipita indica DSM 11827]
MREDKENDTMDNWDEEKLRKVVLSKAGNPRTTTDIVCKYFIEAIETKKFGWFWECPNGQDCMYRHALPPGFVLKSEKKALDDAAKANTISLEEFLEVERHKLGPNLTPVTPETFAQWKKTRLDKKAAEQEALKKAKETQNAAGRWFEEEDDEGDAEDAEGGGWDIERMRKETEAEAEREEELRMEEMRKEFETTSV